MSGSAKEEQRQGGTWKDSSRVEGSVIYHLLPLGGSVLPWPWDCCEFICVCLYPGMVRWWINKQRTKTKQIFWILSKPQIASSNFLHKEGVLCLPATPHLCQTPISQTYFDIAYLCAVSFFIDWFVCLFVCFGQDNGINGAIYQFP